MKIRDDVWLAGSGQIGFEMTHFLDCNVYLLGDGEKYALVDGGAGVEPERIVERIAQAGIPMRRVELLLLTHAHADHAGGAAFFRETYGLRIVVSEEAASWLDRDNHDRTSVKAAIGAGVYPSDYVLRACRADRTVREGDTIAVGRLELRVIETPGHSRGHVSYLLEEDGVRSLFSGDAVFAGGKVVLQNIWDCSIPEYAATMDKLDELDIHRLYPGHGPFLCSSAGRHIAKARAFFRKLDVPPNL